MPMLRTGSVVTVYVGIADEARVAELLARDGHTWLRSTGVYVAPSGAVDAAVFRVSVHGLGSGRLVKKLRAAQQSIWLTFDVAGEVGF
ncbi:hypothetical protein TSST111916_18545 [Tsukamurella strandjordii]|uniref:hypothetical protein n=1 Tax=Tsukamurella TaxID=2060 RepID=UPI001C7D7567|nr:hypothetical protein [Tsukamurella sp. TY48]GIZ95750.1 hypothetical protein TTY48_03620 [Tsukamurella sp. TY48]